MSSIPYRKLDDMNLGIFGDRLKPASVNNYIYEPNTRGAYAGPAKTAESFLEEALEATGATLDPETGAWWPFGGYLQVAVKEFPFVDGKVSQTEANKVIKAIRTFLEAKNDEGKILFPVKDVEFRYIPDGDWMKFTAIGDFDRRSEMRSR